MKKITDDIFRPDGRQTQAAQGSLLVAEPFLKEKYFKRAVITLIDCPDGGEGGAMGVVMNRAINVELNEVLEGVEKDRHVPLYCGGPMSQDRLYFIHTLGSDLIEGAQKIMPGLWIGGDFEAIIAYVNGGGDLKGTLRFFIGYSGWGESQLNAELDNEVWATLAPGIISPETLLTEDDTRLWHTAVRALGPSYRTWNLLPGLPLSN